MELDRSTYAHCESVQGSIFYRIRNQIQSGKGWDQGFGLQDLKSVISGKIASWLKMEG